MGAGRGQVSGGVHERLRLEEPALIKFLYLLLMSGHMLPLWERTLPLPTPADKPSAPGRSGWRDFFLEEGD